jgi:hypothetical protein
MTLETIIKIENEHRCEGGSFGIIACKEQIEWEVRFYKKSLYQLLEEYVARAKADVFFNKRMVLACWELINEQ